MSINLTPEQQSVIQKAIRSGLVRSVDEFIHSAMQALSRPERAMISRKPALPVSEFVKFARVSRLICEACLSASWPTSATSIDGRVRPGCFRLHALVLRR